MLQLLIRWVQFQGVDNRCITFPEYDLNFGNSTEGVYLGVSGKTLVSAGLHIEKLVVACAHGEPTVGVVKMLFSRTAMNYQPLDR